MSFCLVVAVASVAQEPRAQFDSNEELLYEAEFTRSLLRNLDVADFRFLAERVPAAANAEHGNGSVKSSYALQLKGEVKSKGFFVRLFNLNFLQRVTSVVEPKSFSVQTTKRFDQQGKRQRESETVYDRVNGKVVWTERDLKEPAREPRTASSPVTADVQDVLSAIYFLRTRPLQPGHSFLIKVTDSGRVYDVPIRVAERKKLKTVLGKVDTIKVDVELFGEQRLIQSKGQFSIWLTADQRHVPVKARIKNDFGTFNITLKKVSRNSNIAQAQ